MISDNIVIMTREEYEKEISNSFRRGVDRGKFEQRMICKKEHETLSEIR